MISSSLTYYEKRLEARRMRYEGATIPKIVERLSVARSTAFQWVKDIELTPEQAKSIKSRPGTAKGCEALSKKYQAIRDQARDLGAEKAKNASPLMVAGCMLYWGEGSKKVNQVIFTNTDKDMIELFSNFLRREIGVKNEKIKVSAIIHDGYGNKTKEECSAHWSEVTGTANKVEVYESKDKRPISRKNRHPYGICVVSVYDVTVVQMIYGALETIIGKHVRFGR